VEFLQRRFAGRKLDLVVPINFPATSFSVRHRQRLFPETPMLIPRWNNAACSPIFLRVRLLSCLLRSTHRG
jgi:hypothetical protein